MTAQVVAIIEGDRSSSLQSDDGFAVTSHRIHREFDVTVMLRFTQSQCFLETDLVGNVSAQCIVGTGLVGDHVRNDAPFENLWNDVGGIPE